MSEMRGGVGCATVACSVSVFSVVNCCRLLVVIPQSSVRHGGLSGWLVWLASCLAIVLLVAKLARVARRLTKTLLAS
jgi:hypothetical protein